MELLAKSLPQIENLAMNFQKTKLTGSGIVHVMNECKQLKKIVIYSGFRIYDEDIEKLCRPVEKKIKNDEWKIDIDGGTIEITKK